MKLQQFINARTLVALFLATASISGYQVGELWSGMKAAEAAADKANTGAEKAKQQLSKLQRMIGDAPESEAPMALESLADISAKARRSATAHGLVIATVSGGQDVLATADRLPGTTLRSVRMSYRGAYSSYDDLKAWVAELHSYGAAIVRVGVTGREFQVAIRIYGKDDSNG